MAEKWKLEIQGMTCSFCATHVSDKDGVVVDWKQHLFGRIQDDIHET